MEPLTSNFWLTEAALLYQLVFDIVDEAAERGALNAAQAVIQMLLNVQMPDVDYDLLNEAAHTYAAQHSFNLVSGITQTSQRSLQDAFTEWIASGRPLPALTDSLAPMFGPVRAGMIAATEITRVYADSNIMAWREFGVDAQRFQTAVDDVVCPRCSPFAGKEYPLGDVDHTPPIHVRCRCYLQPVVRIPGEPSPQRVADGWPAGPDGLESVRSLGGSTGAELVRDPATGRQYVMKRGASAEHVRREALADDAYRALGQRVPAARIYETPDGPVKLAEFIEGEQFGGLWKRGQVSPATLIELQDGFAADVLMGNRDVLGLDFDNILIDADGHPWRIDNGGSLDFRAQGGAKAFDGFPLELWTMRDAKFNRQGYDIFGRMDYDHVIESARALGPRGQAALAMMPDELEDAFAARLGRLAETVGQYDELTADGWKSAYPDRFSFFGMKMEQAGIFDRLPRTLSNQGVQVFDEEGTPFDHLRGSASVMHDVRQFINGNGGDYGMIQYYMGSQAGSSWSDGSQVLKHWISEQMEIDGAQVYWQNGHDAARREFDRVMERFGTTTYDNTWQAFHSFNYNMLKRTAFQGNDQAAGVVKLIRTESEYVMRGRGFKRGATGVTMPRGLAESASIFQKVTIGGTEVTVQNVPHSRVLGMYFYNREPGTHFGAFLGDNENEFIFIPHGLKFDWLKKK